MVIGVLFVLAAVDGEAWVVVWLDSGVPVFFLCAPRNQPPKQQKMAKIPTPNMMYLFVVLLCLIASFSLR
jgi:hypothetical protein